MREEAKGFSREGKMEAVLHREDIIDGMNAWNWWDCVGRPTLIRGLRKETGIINGLKMGE